VNCELRIANLKIRNPKFKILKNFMKILLTNDDGIYADGLCALYQAIQQAGHEVIVVAPHTQQSAVGHAITVSDPLRVAKVEIAGRIRGYAVQGTPADCVKIALNALLDETPDMVLSGINEGANTGHHVIYSGTVSAATEATMFRIPSVALSLNVSLMSAVPYDYTHAARFAVRLCDIIKQQGGLPEGTLLNVNVPEGEPMNGVKICKQARFRHADVYEKRIDPRNRVYYWLKEEEIEVIDPPEVDADYRLLNAGYIVITPIHYDLTDYTMLARLKVWSFNAT
jgi:5'-nucleotidase